MYCSGRPTKRNVQVHTAEEDECTHIRKGMSFAKVEGFDLELGVYNNDNVPEKKGQYMRRGSRPIQCQVSVY